VIVNEGRRQIPVQYARRVRGGQQGVGQMTYLPLRINQAGVIPIIFAISLVLIPGTVANFLMGVSNTQVADIANKVAQFFNQTSPTYMITYFILVVAFTFFYTAVTFNPERISENLQKQGGFVPGVRPGKATAEYLNRILTRITVPGSLFLGTIAIMPIGVQLMFPDLGTIVTLGGTSLLILVSVAVETVRTMESMMVMRGYEKFIS
jgi:preprotein translocase subunit SecY